MKAHAAHKGASPAPSSAPPDWSHVEDQIRCPECDYNLRGLIEPRCPECAYEFTWSEILNPTRRTHPYLFEHHPKQNLRSFWHTAVNSSLRPSRFWTSIRYIQSYRVNRMVLYWLLTSLFYLFALACLFVAGIVVAKMARPSLGVDAIAADMWQTGDYWSLVLATLPWLWPWLTFLGLIAIGAMLGKGHDEWMANLRCAIYSYDLSFWIGLYAIIISILAPLILVPGDYEDHVVWVARLLPFAWLIGCYRFAIACKRYLRFDYPVLTATIAQVAICFAVWCIIRACNLDFPDLDDMLDGLAAYVLT